MDSKWAMEARKTEYRNIVFASKAEARFRLFLDSQNKNWWYEPESLRLDCGYVPDFMLVELNVSEDEYDGANNPSNFGLQLTLIEYKPKRPTQTYIEELAVRFKTIGDRLHSEETLDIMQGCFVNAYFYIMVGGMGYDKAECLLMSWEGPYEPMYVRSYWEKGWGVPFDGICPDRENKLLSKYRFDLEHAPPNSKNPRRFQNK